MAELSEESSNQEGFRGLRCNPLSLANISNGFALSGESAVVGPEGLEPL
jgi:hypothetical protein